MNNNQTAKFPVVLVAVFFVGALLIGGYLFYSQKTRTAPESSMIDVSELPAEDSEADQTITVEGKEFSFTPNTITVKKGQTIRLIFKNAGKTEHDWVIDQITGAKTNVIKGGETDSVVFTPSASGTFEFYCSIGAHRALGMKGTLIVEE